MNFLGRSYNFLFFCFLFVLLSWFSSSFFLFTFWFLIRSFRLFLTIFNFLWTLYLTDNLWIISLTRLNLLRFLLRGIDYRNWLYIIFILLAISFGSSLRFSSSFFWNQTIAYLVILNFWSHLLIFNFFLRLWNGFLLYRIWFTILL